VTFGPLFDVVLLAAWVHCCHGLPSLVLLDGLDDPDVDDLVEAAPETLLLDEFDAELPVPVFVPEADELPLEV